MNLEIEAANQKCSTKQGNIGTIFKIYLKQFILSKIAGLDVCNVTKMNSFTCIF